MSSSYHDDDEFLDYRCASPNSDVEPSELVSVTKQEIVFSDDKGVGHSELVSVSKQKTEFLAKLSADISPVTMQAFSTQDDLPKTVAWTFSQGSSPTSMDFHPIQQTLLLVGTSVGDILLWEAGSRELLFLKIFNKVQDRGACRMTLQAFVGVKRIIWSPDGSLFGVAYSKDIVQIYSYHGDDVVRLHLELDAHFGGVNDLAFSYHDKQLCVITCGDDKTVKVWDAASGTKIYTFENHKDPVLTVVCPYKEGVPIIFSAAADGTIIGWFCNNRDTPEIYITNLCYTTLAYFSYGSRMFFSGTTVHGDSHIAEWDPSKPTAKRTYHGLRGNSSGHVQFDTSKNGFLAAGDEFLIKIWDMDNSNLLTTIDADGGLPESPRIRFNKEGTLLAVSANDDTIKLLATNFGLRLLQAKNSSFEASRVASKDNEGVEHVSEYAGLGSADNTIREPSELSEESDIEDIMDYDPSEFVSKSYIPTRSDWIKSWFDQCDSMQDDEQIRKRISEEPITIHRKFIIRVDGYYRKDKKPGYGAIICDYLRKPIIAESKVLQEQNGVSPFYHEVQGVDLGLELAVRYKVTNFCFYCTSSDVAEFFGYCLLSSCTCAENGKFLICETCLKARILSKRWKDELAVLPVIRKIINNLSELESLGLPRAEFRLCAASRERNKVADCLAKLGEIKKMNPHDIQENCKLTDFLYADAVVLHRLFYLGP